MTKNINTSKYRIANNPSVIKEKNIKQEQFNKEAMQKMFASIQKMKMLTGNYDSQRRSSVSTLSKFDNETVAKYLQNPIANEKLIRNVSNYLYSVNAQYKRIIWYFALMPTYAYVLNPVDIPVGKIDKAKYTKSYVKTLQSIDKLNIRHEMIKALKVAFKEDVFYGYEYESKDSFFIKKLDADYCRISSEEDGVYNYQFDFTYFDIFKDSLEIFPEEFKEKYLIFKATKERWIELDSNKTICLKVNEELQYPLPPFNSMFEAIFEYDEYKKIKIAKTKMDNFMMLIQKIPMDEKNPEMNKFLIDLDLASQFHGMAESALADGVGLVTSPMDIEAIKMEKGKSDNDMVAQALRAIHDDGGVSQFIFNSDKNTGVGLDKSITSDEQIVFAMLRQIERWINRKLKRQSGVYKFQLKFLDMTVFNQHDFYKRYLESAQASMPVISELGASLGLTPLELYNKARLENEILGLHNMLTPLQSAHTQGKDDAGRPTKSDDDISASTEVVKNNQ